MIPRISIFASTGYLLVHRRGRIMYYMVEFKTVILTLNKLSFINLIKFDHHWREIMLQQLNVVDDSCESTRVKEKGEYFEHKLWHFGSSITQYYSCCGMLNCWLLLIISRWIMLWIGCVLSGGPYLQTFTNDVIGCNEYLISTWSESTIPSVYSLQFLFKSTYHSWSVMEIWKKMWVGVFFLNTV